MSSDKAVETSKELSRKWGVLVGPTSSANFEASRQVTEKKKEVVTVFPDGGERYLGMLKE